MEIGIAPGVRIILNVDGEPLCRGASLEYAIVYAERKARVAKGEQRDLLRRWIEAANRKIEKDEFEARVNNEYKKEYSSVEKHANRLPAFAREPVEALMREQIRKRLDPEKS